jgi:hypothetical protein
MWMDAIVALTIKLVITKVGGVKALEEKVLPAVVGFCTGYGALFLFRSAQRDIPKGAAESHGYVKY